MAALQNSKTPGEASAPAAAPGVVSTPAPAAPAAAPTAPADPLAGPLKAASDALKLADGPLQQAQTLVLTLQGDAASSSTLSLDAQIQALNGTAADLAGASPSVSDQRKVLVALKKTLTDAKAALGQAVPADQAGDARVEATNTAFDGDIKALGNLTGTADGGLTAAAAAVAAHVRDVAQALDDRLNVNGMTSLAAAEVNPKAIRPVLSGGMDGLVDTISAGRNFAVVWDAPGHSATLLRPLLKSAGVDGAALQGIDSVQKAFTDTVGRVAGDLPGWFGHLVGDDETAALTKSQAAIAQALSKNARTGPEMLAAPTTLADAQAQTRQLAAVESAWPKLAAALEPAFPDLTAQANSRILTLATEVASLSDITAQIDEMLTGDLGQFVSDQVRLFYFTDVPQLMRVLNSRTDTYPNGGAVSQSRADAARHDLIAAESAAASALTDVNEAKSRLRSIQEDIRLVGARARDAANQAATAHALQKQLQQQQRDYQKKIDATTDPDAKKALQDTMANVITDRVTTAGKAVDTADKNRQSAQDAQDQLQTESSALPLALADAQSALTAAWSNVNKQRVLASELAQLESDAFAQARDNQPYLFAPARATSTDPAQRVILFASPGSKTLYIRGRADDVRQVKRIIADFDRPAPQARVTLWTLQFNGSDTRVLNEIVGRVDQRLLLTRTNIGLIHDALRDALASVVNDAARASGIRGGGDSQGRLRRYAFYQPEVLERLGYDLSASQGFPPPAATAKVSAANAKPITEADLTNDDAFVTRFTLPDPARATTLGEMLFVLSLANATDRNTVVLRFLAAAGGQIPTHLPHLGGKDPQNSNLESFVYGLINTVSRLAGTSARPATPEETTADFWKTFLSGKAPANTAAVPLLAAWAKSHPTQGALVGAKDLGQFGFYPRFPSVILGSLMQPLAAPVPGALPTDYADMTPNQNEILLALQAQTRDNVALEVQGLIRNIGLLPTGQRLNTNAAHLFRTQYLPLVGWLNTKFNRSDASQGTAAMSWFQRGLVATGIVKAAESARDLAWCEEQLTEAERHAQQHWPEAKRIMVTRPQSGVNLDALQADREAWIVAQVTGQHNSLGQATPRVAAADDMIKRLIITAEDDLDYFFVQPALEGIRQDVTRKGVEFGSFQRESLLATNRQVARLDPRANVDLKLPTATNFLDEASQLAQIGDRFRQEQNADKLSSSGPATLAGAASLLGSRGGTALGIGAAASLLGDLLARPSPPGEIYSINSGNLFKVTPIFDPSGQALRFQFDYAGTTDVREPNGTTNPSVPRVERHTVNTEVQLSNLELREVSRFESNSALGVPEVRTGGIPLLKHVPVLRDIPLIGYFTQTGGQKAVRQQSLIFAQTSMYPTVGDIVGLLVDVPPLDDLDRSTPDYLLFDVDQAAAATAGTVAPSKSASSTTVQPTGGLLPMPVFNRTGGTAALRASFRPARPRSQTTPQAPKMQKGKCP